MSKASRAFAIARSIAAIAFIEYAKIKDWFFVMTTLAVLTVLLVSIALAMGNR